MPVGFFDFPNPFSIAPSGGVRGCLCNIVAEAVFVSRGGNSREEGRDGRVVAGSIITIHDVVR